MVRTSARTLNLAIVIAFVANSRVANSSLEGEERRSWTDFADISLRAANSDIITSDVTVAVFHLIESLREEIDTAVVESSTAIER